MNLDAPEQTLGPICWPLTTDHRSSSKIADTLHPFGVPTDLFPQLKRPTAEIIRLDRWTGVSRWALRIVNSQTGFATASGQHLR